MKQCLFHIIQKSFLNRFNPHSYRRRAVLFYQSEGGDSTERLIAFLGARMVEGLFPGEALSPVVVAATRWSSMFSCIGATFAAAS